MFLRLTQLTLCNPIFDQFAQLRKFHRFGHVTVHASLKTGRILDGQPGIATHPRSFDRRRQIEDSAHVETLVASKRESKSRPDAGIVEFEHKAFKQDGTLVAQCRRQVFMRKKPA